jgi:hypothetical protein
MFRRVLLVLCVLALVAPLPATDPPKKPTPDEVRKKFYQCWLELDRVDAGVAVKGPDNLCGVEFAEKAYWVWARRGELSTCVDGDLYRVRIDATAEPMRVDIVAPKRSGQYEMMQVGIFKFDGDKMTLALAPWAYLEPSAKGKDHALRPKTFESTKENKVMVSTYKPTAFWGWIECDGGVYSEREHEGRMQATRAAWGTLFTLGVALVALGAWFATRPHASREATEALLKPCIGKPAREVVQLLGLADAKRYWVDEPPGILRGVSYYPNEKRSIKLYIAEGEPLFRQFNDQFEWDYDAFLTCRIGGIQYESGGVVLDVGSAVPWQWRRP